MTEKSEHPGLFFCRNLIIPFEELATALIDHFRQQLIGNKRNENITHAGYPAYRIMDSFFPLTNEQNNTLAGLRFFLKNKSFKNQQVEKVRQKRRFEGKKTRKIRINNELY